MNVITRGIRNAFRNAIRTVSIVVILGLSVGLSLTMLIAHQAVTNKINQVKGSIGNTVTIAPAGYSGFSQVNNALTVSQLSKVRSIPHVVNVTEALTDRLTTIGSTSPSFGGRSNTTATNNQTSLTSPVKLNLGARAGGGRTAHVFVNGGNSIPTNFTLPITITGTNDATSLDGSSLSITSGKIIDGSKDTSTALISSRMASKNNLKVGSTFTAYGTSLTVAGIFTTGTHSAEGTVLVSLPTEQRLSGQSGDVTGAVATVDSADNLNSATAAIKNAMGSSADVTSSQDEANATIQPLDSVKNVSLYSLIGAVVAGGVIILLTMVMIVRERRREIGVIKAIGGSNLRIMFQFMAEALTLTILGAVIGLVIGIVGGNPVTKTLVNNSSTSTTSTNSVTPGSGFGDGNGGGGHQYTSRRAGSFFSRQNSAVKDVTDIHADIGWSIILYGLGAAVLIALIGSAIAAGLIARVRPSEVMRVE